MTLHVLGITVCVFSLYNKKYMLITFANKKKFQASFLVYKINRLARFQNEIQESVYFKTLNGFPINSISDLIRFSAMESNLKCAVFAIKQPNFKINPIKWSDKTWNVKSSKWEKHIVLLNRIKITRQSIFKGYPDTKGTVLTNYKLSLK